MPDLTLVPYYYCKSNDSFKMQVKDYIVRYGFFPDSEYERDWHCTCKGFRFKGKCKHIDRAKEKFCGWDQFITDAELDDGNCPVCGGPVEIEYYGV